MYVPICGIQPLAEEQVRGDYDIPEVTVMLKHLVIYVAK